MSIDDRDPLVARALATLPVPEHRAQFWSRLDDAVRAAGPIPSAPRRDRAPTPPTPVPAGAEGPTPLLELPAARRPGPDRPHRRRAVAAAAAVLLLVGATAGVRLVRADRGPATRPGASPDAPADTTVAASVDVTPPEVVVAAFLDAVGAGDVAAARAALGPLSLAYLPEVGGVDAMLQVSSEGYGAWVGSTDRTLSVVPLDAGDAVVVVAGTRTAEGVVETRMDAVPVVRGADGGWLVELWAFAGELGGRVGLLGPDPDPDGVRVVRAGDEVALGVAAPGTAWFSLPGVTAQPVVVAGANRTARWVAPVDAPAVRGPMVAAFRTATVFTAVAVPVAVG